MRPFSRKIRSLADLRVFLAQMSEDALREYKTQRLLLDPDVDVDLLDADMIAMRAEYQTWVAQTMRQAEEILRTMRE